MRWPSFFPFRKPDAPESGRLAMGNYNFTAQLPNGRAIQFAGYTYSDDTPQDVAERLDAIQDQVDRVRSRCEIPELEAARDQKIKLLENMRDVLSELESRQKTGDKLSSTEIMQIQNLRVNLGKAKEDIEKGQQAIVEAKRKAGLR
jgi:hypothetical protein